MHMFSSSRILRAATSHCIAIDKEGTETMDTQKLLGEVAGQLLSGAIEVVDLSAPLGPDTPLIKLPPELRRRHAEDRDPQDLRL